MQPVGSQFVFLPKRGLRFVAVPGVTLPGHVRVKQRLVPEFVSAQSPRECILCPNNLAPDLEARSIQGVLKLAMPRRWMKTYSEAPGFTIRR
jgi:hypothetical protein